MSFTGSIHISYGIYLPTILQNSENPQIEINNCIHGANGLETAYLTFSTMKLFKCEKQRCGVQGIRYCSLTQKWPGMFGGKNQTAENLFSKIKSKKGHVKEYKSRLFDKTKYNVESGIQIDYEENDNYIQYIARNITENLENPTRKEIAKAVYMWVKTNVDYEYPAYHESKYYASQTAKLKKGNCCDQSRLIIALCRAAGIPRQATEYYHSECVELGNGKIVGHVWPVIMQRMVKR